jgi:hypothetical protein
MRAALVFLLSLVACGGPDPRLIKGGGIGDGSIGGTLNIYVIDNETEQPIQGATVEVGTKQKTTDKTGLVVYSDVNGPQTIAISATGYRGTVWVKANGANVTIPVTKLGLPNPDQATLSGSINNWASVTVPTGHGKAALVLFSANDAAKDDENNIKTPNNMNVCGVGMQVCNFSVNTRTGTVSLLAEVVDIDPATNTQTIIGAAVKTGIQVASGINQTGITLDLVDAGNLETVTIDFGAPPGALAKLQAVIGYELSGDEVAQLYVVPAGATSVLVPKTSVYAGTTTRRLTAVAQSTAVTNPPQSAVIRRGLSGSSLSAGTWLDTPAGATITRTNATFSAVTGALAHSVQWADATGVLLDITSFDAKTTTFDVPSLVALPTTGALTAAVNAIGATFSPNDFSLDDDRDKLWGISTQPAPVN